MYSTPNSSRQLSKLQNHFVILFFMLLNCTRILELRKYLILQYSTILLIICNTNLHNIIMGLHKRDLLRQGLKVTLKKYKCICLVLFLWISQVPSIDLLSTSVGLFPPLPMASAIKLHKKINFSFAHKIQAGHYGSSVHHSPCLTNFLFTAILKLHADFPVVVCLISRSAVSLPINIILFIKSSFINIILIIFEILTKS